MDKKESKISELKLHVKGRICWSANINTMERRLALCRRQGQRSDQDFNFNQGNS